MRRNGHFICWRGYEESAAWENSDLTAVSGVLGLPVKKQVLISLWHLKDINAVQGQRDVWLPGLRTSHDLAQGKMSQNLPNAIERADSRPQEVARTALGSREQP